MKQCIYCGSMWNPEREHVKAASKGGVTTVRACQACNRSKGKKSLMQWLRWLKINDKYRWNQIKNYNYGRRNNIARTVQKVRDEG